MKTFRKKFTMQGLRKFQCQHCEATQFEYPGSKHYAGSTATRKLRCKSCGSTFLEPVSKPGVKDDRALVQQSGQAYRDRKKLR